MYQDWWSGVSFNSAFIKVLSQHLWFFELTDIDCHTENGVDPACQQRKHWFTAEINKQAETSGLNGNVFSLRFPDCGPCGELKRLTPELQQETNYALSLRRMGGSGSKAKGVWPFSGSGAAGGEASSEGHEQCVARLKGSRTATPLIFTRRR